MPRHSKKRQAARSKGLRSGFELEVAAMLDEKGISYDYETETFSWQEKIPNARCGECGGSAYVDRSYTPDFFLSNGTIIEAKGRFTVKDRKIASAMKEQGRDIKLVFQFNNKLSRKSKTRYTEWCEKLGIDCAVREVPDGWIQPAED